MKNILFCLSGLLFLLTVNKQLAAQDNTIDSLRAAGIKKARRGEYKSAVADFRKAADYATALKDTTAVIDAVSFIGHVERRRANHDAAVANYEKARGLLFQQAHPDTFTLIQLYNGLGSANRYLGRGERSIDFYFAALELARTKYPPDHYRIGFLYNNIANTYDEEGDLESALQYYTLSKDILETRYKNDSEELSNIYNNYGDILLKLNRNEDAESYFVRAVQLQEQEPNNRSPHLIIGLEYLGVISTRRGRYSEAVDYLSQALSVAGLESLDSKSFNRVNSPSDCIKTLHRLVGTYNLWYEETKDDSYLVKAKEVLSLAENFIEYLKLDFKETGARTVLLKDTYPIYEKAISVALNADFESKEAFDYSEKSRNTLLREAVRDTEAKQFAGIPDSLLKTEILLKRELTGLRKKRFDEEESGSAKEERIALLDAQIAGLKSEYSNLLETFEKNYPDYFALKYEGKTVDVEEVQKELLSGGRTLLEYFVGEESIFAFIISTENYKVIELNKDFNLQDSVKLMRESIFQWRPRAVDATKNLDTYRRTAHFLYRKLLEPIRNDLPEKLIIVPGGVLGYLPFEALLTEETSENQGFADYPYLIKEKQISYCYSATLLRETLKNQNTGREVLGFAPSFGDLDKDSLAYNLPYLRDLKHNENEVDAIQKLLGGRVFKGEDATLRNFLDIAPLYKILHLATHGKTNDTNNDFSYLAFTYQQDSLDNELLYAGNLYNLDLRADMVVLSACETGIGELQQGEGILSIARAFFYAGAKSIVTTLWSIDDKASLEIMVDFYQGLENGAAKDEALRDSKLSFINNNSRRAHPLFWAAYVPIGNMESIAIGRESDYLPYLLGGFVLLLGLFFYMKSRK